MFGTICTITIFSLASISITYFSCKSITTFYEQIRIINGAEVSSDLIAGNEKTIFNSLYRLVLEKSDSEFVPDRLYTFLSISRDEIVNNGAFHASIFEKHHKFNGLNQALYEKFTRTYNFRYDQLCEYREQIHSINDPNLDIANRCLEQVLNANHCLAQLPLEWYGALLINTPPIM